MSELGTSGAGKFGRVPHTFGAGKFGAGKLGCMFGAGKFNCPFGAGKFGCPFGAVGYSSYVTTPFFISSLIFFASKALCFVSLSLARFSQSYSTCLRSILLLPLLGPPPKPPGSPPEPPGPPKPPEPPSVTQFKKPVQAKLNNSDK